MVLPRSSTVAPLLALFVGLVVGSSFQSFRDANVLVYESKQLRSDAPHQSTGNDEILLKASVAEEEGWRSIQVFSGPPKSFTPNMLYSEVRQDAVVLALMRHQPGYFIDLASNDAQFLSNTAALERSYNWTGLCIEPNPKYWYDLAMTRKCQVVAAVVGDIRNEPVDFQMEKEGLGGIIGENFDNQQADDSSRVPSFTVTLLEILKRNNAPNVIDYMSLDIEGAESYVMMHFPFTSYKIKILTLERPKDDLKNHLLKNGYEFQTTMARWGETLWIHSDFKQELDMEALNQFGFESDQ